MSHTHTKGRKARQFPGTVGALKLLIEYDPETGDMRTGHPYMSKGIIRKGNRMIALPDTIARSNRGARKTNYYRCDHLAWYLMTGTWPSGWMERVNGLHHDLRIENLVMCSAVGIRFWYGPPEEGMQRQILEVYAKDGIFSDGPVTHEVDIGGRVVQRPVLVQNFRERMKQAVVYDEG